MEDSENLEGDMPKLSLEQENEFKRLKLELESGAVLPDFKQANMPPEIEGMFLDNIFSFHNAYKNAKQISIYERIGSPDFKLAKVLNDEQISGELDRFITLLGENGIGFETLFEYDERLIYEFVTTELFELEVDDIRLSNMMMHFVYEEFYPNDEQDIKRYCEEFWTDFLKKDSSQPFFETDATSAIKQNKELQLFLDAFESFTILKNTWERVVFNKKRSTAIADVNLHFLGYLSGEKEPVVFSGTSKVKLKHNYGYWHITAVDLVKN